MNEQNTNANREIKIGSRWQNKRCPDITATILDIDDLGILYRYEDNAMKSRLTKEFFETYTHISDPEEPTTEATKPSSPTDEDHGIEFGREYCYKDTGEYFIPDHVWEDLVLGYEIEVGEDRDANSHSLDYFISHFRPHNWAPAHKWKDGDEAWMVCPVKGISEIAQGRIKTNRFGKLDFDGGRSNIFSEDMFGTYIFPTYRAALEAALKAEMEGEK